MKKQFTTILMVALCGLSMITSSLRAQDSEPPRGNGGGSAGPGVLVPDEVYNYNPTHYGAPVGTTFCATIVGATDAVQDANGNIIVILATGGVNYNLTGTPVAGQPDSYHFCFDVRAEWCGVTSQIFYNEAGHHTSGDYTGFGFSYYINGQKQSACTPPCNMIASVSQGDPIACNGGTTTVTVTATNGTAPFNGTGTFTVGAGTYSYTVTDANGCTAQTSITVSQPSLLTASSTSGSIACFGGATTVTVSGDGGTAPYSGTGDFTVNAGTYSYTVTDANGCTATTSITVSEPALLTASSTSGSIACFGGSTTVTVSGDGGTAPYSGTGSFTVTAGSYSYTVTDANGCTATTSITVTEPTLLTATSVSGSISCFGGSTTVTVSGNGGTAPYSGTGDFTVNAGTYTYTVTDANGCTATTSITVTEPTQLTAASSSGSIACFGGSTTVTVSASGGTAPYTGTGNFTVTAGSYTYTVTDANGCATTTSITVSQPTLLVAASSASSILCFGGSSTVTVSASGGTAPYTGTGSWSVTAGTYTYTVTDANGCSATTSVTVSQPALLTTTASSTQVTGYQCQDGTITVSASGGTTPYSYSLDGGAKQSSNMFAGLAAGNHTVMVTDANGCSATVMVVVTNMSCDGKTTVTQGGWGAKPSGGNWGAYLVANWSSKIGTSLVIGSNGRTITLTSAKAVEDFLPSSGTPRALNSGNMTNPTEKSYGNTLAGQTMAALINVKMFGIGNLVINSGSYAGQSVSQMIAAANIALGGGSGNASALTDALDKINRNYDNGTVNLGFLSCPCRGTTTSGRDVAEANTSTNFEDANVTVSSYPNPFKGTTTIEFYVAKTGHVTLNVFSTNMSATHNLFNGVAEGERTYSVEFTTSNPGMYIYKLSTGNTVKVGKMIAQ